MALSLLITFTDLQDVDISFEQPGDTFGCVLIAELVDAAVGLLPEDWAALPEVAAVMGQIEACCIDSADCNLESAIRSFTGGGRSVDSAEFAED